MALKVGRTHFVPFRVGTVASPVTGISPAGFITVFTRDNADITGASQGLAIVENGTGRYCATYIPTLPGFYYLELYNIANTTLIRDSAEIDPASDLDNFVNLTQDFGGVGALKPIIANSEDYILMVFYSRDWQVGNTDNSFALAMTALDANGNWLTTPLALTSDTYHIVIKNNDDDVIVIRPFLVT